MSSFLIANPAVGLERDLTPWLIPEDAYPNLVNAYIFRGRIPKKKGAARLGSLCFTPAPLPGPFGPFAANPIVIAPVIAGLVPGTLVMTVSSTGETLRDLGNGTIVGNNAVPAHGTIDYSTGNVSITLEAPGSFAPNPTITVTSVCIYPTPRTPVMGVGYRQQMNINFEESVFFDQQFSYRYGVSGFDRIDTTMWNGTDTDFFWTTNARSPLIGNTAAVNNNYFFATNFNNSATPDPIRYLTGTTWADFTPFITSTTTQTGLALYTARCIVPFKNRLLFFNTWEGDLDITMPAFPGNLAAQQLANAKNYPNRLRYSWIGSPLDDGVTSPAADSATSGYLQSPPGRGGFVDAATGEQIISVAVLKDYILVKFETQSWRVVYTNNPFFPFEWQKVNQEFGGESTFSTIQFDEFALSVGNRAITKDTSLGVSRIDEKVPDIVFEIQNQTDGQKRVYGVRDFYREQVYWTMPTVFEGSSNAGLRYPNRMLNFSYRTGAFSIFKDSYTALGRFQNQTNYLWGSSGLVWGSTGLNWGQSSQQQEFEQIAAGNQQGNVFLLQQKADNDPAFEITSVANTPDVSIVVTLPSGMTTPSHNIENGDFVKFSNVQGFSTAVGATVLGIAAVGTTSFSTTIATTPTTGINADVLQGSIVPGSMSITFGAVMYTDLGNGILFSSTAGHSGIVDYENRTISLTFPALGVATAVSATYSYSWLNGRIFAVINATATTIQLAKVVASTDELIPYFIPAAMSPSAFTFGQVAYLTNFVIKTKQMNPLVSQNSSLQIPYMDIYLDGTEGGKAAFLVRTDDFLTSENLPTTTYAGAQWTLSTDSDGRERFWQRIYVNARGEFIQVQFQMSNLQMMQDLSYADFTLHGLAVNVQKAGRLIRTRY